MKVYIVKQILKHGYDCDRIDELAVFDSYEKAIQYQKTLEDPEASENDLILFRNVVEEISLNDWEPWKSKKEWIYDLKGNLLISYPSTEQKLSDFDAFSYEHKFSVGDIVAIKSEFEECSSPLVEGGYAVISDTPVNKDEWINEGGNKDEWDGCYIVNFISEKNLLSHFHLPEKLLKPLTEPLPSEYSFLEIYSEHLKGTRRLPDALLKKIWGDLVVINKEHFDFNGIGT